MRVRLEDTLKQAGGVMVIDGSMSTALENLGCDLNDSLWTAKVLIQEPEKIRKVHYDYLEAGADCGITASYQASVPGLTAKGFSEKEAEDIIVRSAGLFQEARAEFMKTHPERTMPLCLAGCGPYGAYLADGSEYRGKYGVTDEVLYDFHKKRAELLWQAGADVLLFETNPSLHEALIEADIAEQMHADYWISFSCADGSHIWEGNTISECASVLSHDHPHLKMIGVNCTKPMYILDLIAAMKEHTDLPIAVYPNAGEVYDPVSKTWTKEGGDPTPFGNYALRWMEAGASAVGGCCTTVNRHIREVTAARAKYYAAGRPKLIH